MATKKSKSKKENKLGKAKAIVKKINSDLIDASFTAIETTVKTGEKWQKLTAKLVKKTEPLTKQQIKMVVDTAESIKGQLENSTERLKTLVGYDPKMMDNAKKMFTENPLVEKAEEMKGKFEKEVANNKLVKKAEKMSQKLKKNIADTIEEAKEKIEDYAEDALDTMNDKLDKQPQKKAKKTRKKKVTNKKETSTKEEAVTVKEEVVVEKIKVVKTSVTDNLKVIKGIGPVLEKSLNDLNITAYDQIATMTIEDLTNLLNGAGINAKIYDLTGWKAQATLALAGDMDAVKNWEKK
jgi:predicted flap endonuclease-1-like 5' DNA nuclease